MDDAVVEYLWKKVQKPGSYEDDAQSFWHHIYTKKVFTNPEYIIDYEEPPTTEQRGQRKVDQVVRKFMIELGAAYVLIFHEIKRNEIENANLEYCEKQAFDACESYCKKHNIAQLYTQTSVGTRARFWQYKPGSWIPLDGLPLGAWTAYQEFGDKAGEKYILGWLHHIMSKDPALPEIKWILDPSRNAYYYLTETLYVYADGTKLVRSNT